MSLITFTNGISNVLALSLLVAVAPVNGQDVRKPKDRQSLWHVRRSRH